MNMFKFILIRSVFFNILTIVFVIINLLECIETVPSQRQTQELMLLEALGRRNPVGGTNDAQGIIDMLGRSMLIIFVNYLNAKINRIGFNKKILGF